MKLYATLIEYAKECGFSEMTAKRRLKEGILKKIEAVKGQSKIAGYVDIYEANLYFAHEITNLHLKTVKEPVTTFGKAIENELKNLS